MPLIRKQPAPRVTLGDAALMACVFVLGFMALGLLGEPIRRGIAIYLVAMGWGA